jgi:hypothetical protein
MKKLGLLLLFFCTSLSSQELISEFETQKASSDKSEVQTIRCNFKLFKNKLVQTFPDEKLAKILKKNSQPTEVVYSYPFNKIENDNTLFYEHKDKTLLIRVILIVNNEKKEMVKIKLKSEEEESLNSSHLYF